MAFASGYFKTSYDADFQLVETKSRWAALVVGSRVALIIFPHLPRRSSWTWQIRCSSRSSEPWR